LQIGFLQAGSWSYMTRQSFMYPMLQLSIATKLRQPILLPTSSSLVLIAPLSSELVYRLDVTVLFAKDVLEVFREFWNICNMSSMRSCIGRLYSSVNFGCNASSLSRDSISYSRIG
ncbi:hypothetical protein KCU66_g71, partial [Aureobasidium melanogenum]